MKNTRMLLVTITMTVSLNAVALIKTTSSSSIDTAVSTSSPAQTFPTSTTSSTSTFDSAPVGVSATTYTNDFQTQPASSGTISGATQWTNVNTQTAVNYNPPTNTTSTSSTPLLSTVPQFNVKDVKVTASGNCEVRKNGAVIKSGPYNGSPCHKIYGTGLQASGSISTTGAEVLPEYYRDPDFSALQEYQSGMQSY